MGGLSEFGAGNQVRTGDLNLGKVALYQLSYARMRAEIVAACGPLSRNWPVFTGYSVSAMMKGHAARKYTIMDQIVMIAASTSSTKPIV